MTQVTIDKRDIEVKRPDKVMFPEAGYTKLDVAEYYKKIAQIMMPHINNRPITMHRYPDGISGKNFIQQEAPKYFPDWIKRFTVEDQTKRETTTHLVIDEPSTLIYLADQAAIPIHIWQSRIDKINYPDRLTLDLDPKKGFSFSQIAELAFYLRDLLKEAGLTAYAMLSGSRGIHVVCPLDKTVDFDGVFKFAKDITAYTEKNYRKTRGKPNVIIDPRRNAYAQTSAAPYSIRAREGAPVAAPVEWDELKEKDMHSQKFNIESMIKRVGEIGDIWKGMENNAAPAKMYLQKRF